MGERPGNRVEALHTPVMVDEVLRGLSVESGGRYVDCTVGEGGHALAILAAGGPAIRLLGLDLDPEALEVARHRLEAYGDRVTLVEGNFAELELTAVEHGASPADGVLFDLGLSALQVETAQRGFSFRRDARLDMRFGPWQTVTAHQLVNHYSEARLAEIIFHYGEEPRARRIARAIVNCRPVETTTHLANVVLRAVGGESRRVHPATRTFQAIRIAVNGELENIAAGVEQAIRILRTGGRVVVISYHSLEDRVVKTIFRRSAAACICPPGTPVCVCGHQPTVRLINKRIIRPSSEEVASNPRSRSAVMRVAERI